MAGRGRLLEQLEAAWSRNDFERARRLAERLRYRAGWIPGPVWRDRLVGWAGVEPWWIRPAPEPMEGQAGEP